MNKGEKADGSGMNRREFLTWAAATAALLFLPGCEPYIPESQQQASMPRPRPAVSQSAASAYASPAYIESPQPTYIYVQQPAPAVTYAPAPARSGSVKINAMSRNSWGATPAVPAKMRPMNAVARITIHHEGSAKPNNDNTPGQVAATLRLIQTQHRKRMGAGDIGYHFIIDRTGRIWQGRDWRYQGAHTSGANPNNLGIMLLGNFEIQQPTKQQLTSLQALTYSLMRKFNLSPAQNLHMHCDFGNTQCPGKNLKPYVQAMRKK